MREPFFDTADPSEQKLFFTHLRNAQSVQTHANNCGRSTILTTAPRFCSYSLIINPKETK